MNAKHFKRLRNKVTRQISGWDTEQIKPENFKIRTLTWIGQQAMKNIFDRYR